MSALGWGWTNRASRSFSLGVSLFSFDTVRPPAWCDLLRSTFWGQGSSVALILSGTCPSDLRYTWGRGRFHSLSVLWGFLKRGIAGKRSKSFLFMGFPSQG